MITGIVILLTLLVLATWLALARQRTALYCAFFFSAWGGLDMDIGVHLTAYQIFLAPLFIVTFFRSFIIRHSKIHITGGVSLSIFMLFVIFWSLFQIPFIPEQQVTGGIFRTPEIRSITQIVMFIFSVSPVILVPLILRNRNELIVAGKVYLSSVFILAVLGWIQLFVWYGTGTNPMPIGLVNELLSGDGAARSGVYWFKELQIYRMNSFGGEPKYLGAYLVVALLIIQSVLLGEIGRASCRERV